MPSLLLIRGLPGSGKSTIAKNLVGWYWHIETDQYWIDKETGEYKFDFNRLAEAHDWCRNKTREMLNMGQSVVVSNTFTTAFELLPYFDIAKELGIKPQVILCQGQFGNIHNVPDEVLTKMAGRFEYNVDHLWSRLV